MPKPYALSPERRMQFSELYLLDYIQQNRPIPVFLEGNNTFLENIVATAFNDGLLEIVGDEYRLNVAGLNALRIFMARYSDYLASYDVYHSVDLSTGDFAMAEYWNMDSDDYRDYLSDSRWEDLRVAVAEYKKLDPLEILFMSFVESKRFNTGQQGWQFELALGTAWDEIVTIASSNLQPQDLGVQAPWEDVIQDVINQGAALMANLLVEEQELRKAGEYRYAQEARQAVQVTVVTEVTYYDDPFYVYDFWYDPYW